MNHEKANAPNSTKSGQDLIKTKIPTAENATRISQRCVSRFQVPTECLPEQFWTNSTKWAGNSDYLREVYTTTSILEEFPVTPLSKCASMTQSIACLCNKKRSDKKFEILFRFPGNLFENLDRQILLLKTLIEYEQAVSSSARSSLQRALNQQASNSRDNSVRFLSVDYL